jgi:peroxiredoxin
MKQVKDQAPAFSLKDLQGRTVNLNDLIKSASALVAFFKVECPTCQYTLPFVERLHQALPNVSIIGISQSPAADTAAFAKKFQLTLPLLLDDHDYATSRSYGITTVPSVFLIDKDGKILFAFEGWAKDDFEKLAQLLKPQGGPAPIVFKQNESVQAFKAG